jgi:hypothetical protein
MSDGYTHLNLRADVENSAEKFGLAPDLEAHFATGDLGLEKSAISYQRLEPNKRMPFGRSRGDRDPGLRRAQSRAGVGGHRRLDAGLVG